MRSTLPLVVALLLASSGCLHPPGNGPVIVVTASYPGANTQAVADTVAAPLEQQILGVESMVRLESESRNDGSYVAWVRLQPGADVKLVATLVQNRVALANPDLPDAVARGGVTVTARAAKEVEKDAAIALVDRGGQGHDALQQFSQAALKRLAAEGAIVKPAVFPGAGKPQLNLQIDRQKCAQYGLRVADVTKAVQAAPPSSKIGGAGEGFDPLGRRQSRFPGHGGDVRSGDLPRRGVPRRHVPGGADQRFACGGNDAGDGRGPMGRVGRRRAEATAACGQPRGGQPDLATVSGVVGTIKRGGVFSPDPFLRSLICTSCTIIRRPTSRGQNPQIRRRSRSDRRRRASSPDNNGCKLPLCLMQK